MTERTDQPLPPPSPALEAYIQAAQNSHDIAQKVAAANCDSDLDWRAAELVADARFEEARAAGHSLEEILNARRQA